MHSTITKFNAALVILMCLAAVCSAFPTYRERIPNGFNVHRHGSLWKGVGHENRAGGGARSIIGLAFKDAGYQWTKALCQADTDGDGFTNGEELGDPTCVWTPGGTPSRTTAISHPGYADSTPITEVATPAPPPQQTTPTPAPAPTTTPEPTGPTYLYHMQRLEELAQGMRVPSESVVNKGAIAAKVRAGDRIVGYLDVGGPIDDGQWESFPLAITGICVAHSFPEPNLMTTPQYLANLLKGEAAAMAFRDLDSSTIYSDVHVTLVLPRVSPIMRCMTHILHHLGLLASATYDGTTSPNRRVLWVDDDDAVQAALKAGPNRVAFVPDDQSAAHNKAKVSVHRDGGGTEIVGSRLPTDAAKDYRMDGSLLVTPFPFAAAYPFVVAVQLHVLRPAQCDAWREVVDTFFTARSDALAFAVSSTIALSLPQRKITMWKTFEATLALDCALTAIVAEGSSAIQPSFDSHSHLYFQSTGGTLFNYISTNSGTGITQIVQGNTHIAASDSLFTATETLQNPVIRFAPVSFFSVSVVVNVPTAPSFVVGDCTLVAMLNGTVQYWDDPALVALNPRVTLLHEPIQVVVRTVRSGTTEAFTRGLAVLDRDCNNGVQSIVTRSTWRLKADIGVRTTLDVQRNLLATPWTIGYMSTAAARQAGLREAIIARGNWKLSTDKQFVDAAVNSAQFDPVTNYVAFPSGGASYPFEGTTYFVYRAAYNNRCDEVLRALEFMKWSVADGAARTSIRDTHGTPMPQLVVDDVISDINMVTCAGQFLYPQPEDSGMSVGAIVGIAVGAVVFVALILAALLLRGGDVRDVRNAPKKGQITLLFTDIQDSTKLWGTCPASMSAALDTHHAIIRSAIATFKGYEVKTVGDSFMIAISSASDGVKLAVDIQDRLQKTQFPRAIADVYETEHDEDLFLVEDEPEELAPLHPTWNGLRVRIGVHTGTPEARLDTVTKGYDYYGPPVNVAARVESVAKGGQVLCSADVRKAVASACTFEFTEGGKPQLKGVATPTEVYNVVCPGIKRLFPMIDSQTTANMDSTTAASEIESSEDETNTTATAEAEIMAYNLQMVMRVLRHKDREHTIKLLCKHWRVTPDNSNSKLTLLRIAGRAARKGEHRPSTISIWDPRHSHLSVTDLARYSKAAIDLAPDVLRNSGRGPSTAVVTSPAVDDAESKKNCAKPANGSS